MSKQPKKLALSSEIIRTLSSAELDAVGGQDPTIATLTDRPSILKQCPSQPTTCCQSEVPTACLPSRRLPC